MKFLKRLFDRLEESPLLGDHEQGLMVFTNKVVAQVVDAVVRQSGIRNAARQLAEIRQKLDSYQNTSVHWNTIPSHVFQGAVRERTKLLLIWIILTISEASMNFYALSLMIAPGDTGLRWVLIRMMLALLATIVSIYSAEEFFKKIFWHKRTDMKGQYGIYDGDEKERDIPVRTLSAMSDEAGRKDEKRKRRNRELVERGIWLLCMMVANMVIIAFALARDGGLNTGEGEAEQTNNWVETLGLVLISVLLPTIGGLIYEKIDRLSFLIRAFRKQSVLIKCREKINRELNRLPTVLADKYKRILFKKAQAAYRRILSFEALINSMNRKKKLPKASRRGIEYIEDFNRFFKHLEMSITMLVKQATESRSDELAGFFDRIPALQNTAKNSPVDTNQPGYRKPEPPEQEIPVAPFRPDLPPTHPARLSFTKSNQNNHENY